jgi:large-conductance mechanosensitive channel
MFIPMHNPNAVPVASSETTTDVDAAASTIGLFINAVVEFIIVAFVLFLVMGLNATRNRKAAALPA